MKRLKVVGAIAVMGAMLSIPAVAQTRHFHRRSGVVIGANPFYYGPYYNPWYDPYWGPTYVPQPTTGSLDINTSKYTKNETVYVDGGYAGVAKNVDNLPLAPGTHNVELRNSDGQTVFQEAVNISLGHKTKVNIG